MSLTNVNASFNTRFTSNDGDLGTLRRNNDDDDDDDDEAPRKDEEEEEREDLRNKPAN